MENELLKMFAIKKSLASEFVQSLIPLIDNED